MIILNFFLEDMADPTRLNHAPKRSCLPCKVDCQRHLGECYGFFPALEIGGVSLVENTRKVKALEHFTFLAQLGPVRLFDYSSGRQQFVRELGAG